MPRLHPLSVLLLLLASGLAGQEKPAAPTGTPKPARALHAGTWKFQVKIAMGEQQMSLTQSTTITEDKDGWIATDALDTPAGAATDTATLDKSSLILLRRTVKQGPATIHVELEGNKASGAINMNGKDTPIAADLGGSLFADGPGAPEAIACLPLAEGYTAGFLNLDVQKQKPRLMQLKVTGTESVTVPAGMFEAFRVEISAADGDGGKTTLWIAKASHNPVKISMTVPAMGGATMTAELMP
jgi:hypothetical protein